ncbi:hypothetical protein VTN49DRAFT_7705 [Thermomyces lanuginosus]|uniref:uncharacterized protein n=1 Tax=Thermomyces lanuginosus TaxID=5541 RepID=UPI003742BB9C
MFSVVIPGRPCLTDIAVLDAQPNGQATKFTFTIPAQPAFNHLVVFLLPGTVLPPDTAAAIYLQSPNAKPGPNGPEFKFLGAIGNEKPSAIFKVGSGLPRRTEAQEEDEMLDEDTTRPLEAPNSQYVLGISIEPAQNVAQQMAALEASRAQSQAAQASSSTDLIRMTPQAKQITTKTLAQRIIGNAFNFLASFAESNPNKQGEEVVPLKSFRDWWTKFERRIEMDPSFLERDEQV